MLPFQGVSALVFFCCRRFTASRMGVTSMWMYFSVVENLAWRIICWMTLGGMFSRARMVALVWRQEYGVNLRQPARSSVS